MTKKFEIPVQNVVDSLRDVEFTSIIVVGRMENGGLWIASSTSTVEGEELLNNALGQLDSGEFDD